MNTITQRSLPQDESPATRPVMPALIRPTNRRSQITPPITPWLLRTFTAYSRWYVGRHFHSLRLSRAGLPPQAGSPPLVIYVNHASWWDPLICLLLQNACFTNRQAFAPIDAAALRQYRFFARLGFFGVEQHSARGAAQFIRAATALLAQPNTSLWLTPQGRFADVREQSPQFKAGLGHLPARLERAVFVPLALEYVFWEERKAEVLARFGAPEIISGNGSSPKEWTHHFEQRLQANQAALAIEAQRRQPADFRTLVHSRSGVGFAYDAWRALRAKLTGQPFHREHGDL